MHKNILTGQSRVPGVEHTPLNILWKLVANSIASTITRLRIEWPAFGAISPLCCTDKIKNNIPIGAVVSKLCDTYGSRIFE